MNSKGPVSRVKARKAPEYKKISLKNAFFPAAAVILLLIILFSASAARAQFPRIGISATPDFYTENIDVVLGEEFTLYVCVFGPDDETPIDQEFSSFSWVLHQVCCGATLAVLDVQYSDDYQHDGTPNMGVTSSSEVCVDEPAILLATLTMTMAADEDGDYLAACGPYQQPVDCDGGNPFLMAMTMNISLTGAGSTPTERTGLDAVKALYRSTGE